MKKRLVWLYIGVLFVIFFSLYSINCKTSDDTNGEGSGYLPNLTGKWTGTWKDTVYNVSGTLSVTFSRDGLTITATGSIDLSVLGLGEKTGSGTGTVDENSITFTFTASGVGNGQGTVSGSSATGSGNVGGTLAFGPFTFTGEISGDQINGNFNFTNPGGGAGTVTLTKAQ